MQPEDKVPSIRDLAQTIAENPNTVQKAYRELESQGYFYTVLGQGSFISPPGTQTGESRPPEVDELYDKLRTIVQELIFRGQKPNEISDFIETHLRR